MGFDTADDACVYRVSDQVAVIQTVDFFTPIVDDPYRFGQIAAANALSDVYAMGGEPKLAMNLLCVPNCLPGEVIREILRGGHEKAMEAGCVVAGGHTIQDAEPKYGLCVTGFVHPERVLRNVGAQPGDLLLLTKPLGSGILTTAAKADLAEKADYAACVNYMATLNRTAGEAVARCGAAHACTDITGFGLMGHALEMAQGSGVTLRLESAALPIMPGTLAAAEMGLIPGGCYRNREHAEPFLRVDPCVSQAVADIAADPQTSGGLLVALPPREARALLRELKPRIPEVSIVGRVLPKGEFALELV